MGVLDYELLAARFADEPPQAILAWALEQFSSLAISFSGAEDVVLIDMAVAIKPDVAVFSLDTGRLHPETYRFLDEVRDRYNLTLEILAPDHHQLQAFIREHGLFSFYRDGHAQCCGIRKVEPLTRKLATLDAWVTGQRRDQSVRTRHMLPVVQQDYAFSSEADPLVKINPLANWTSEQVWQYIRVHDVPYNTLHERGFISIGCEPCTRPVLPNQHEREGRWWWEGPAGKECGLHAVNNDLAGRQTS